MREDPTRFKNDIKSTSVYFKEIDLRIFFFIREMRTQSRVYDCNDHANKSRRY